MAHLVADPTRVLFFTGKGGVGKTSAACATAIALARAGRRVLLISTDPASNLDEVLAIGLGPTPTAVPSVPGLAALNLDPEQAARAYRERVVGPYRGVLPASAITSMEEQLSGACTVEIAAFDEFSRLLADPAASAGFDHVVFDTAPTGHTLRLLELPAAWSTFITDNVGGTSCLGPLAGLTAQRALYAAAHAALRDPTVTTLVLVTRAERAAIREAERTRAELAALGVGRVQLIVNAVFVAQDRADPIARALEARGRAALEALPPGLAALPRVDVPLLPFGLVGIEALAAMTTPPATTALAADVAPDAGSGAEPAPGLDALIDELAAAGPGVIMTMGKGGVGKTTVAVRIAAGLARRGRAVTLTTTDPAAHVAAAAHELAGDLAQLEVTRIDPVAETTRYQDEVMASAGADLDEHGRALLAEDLRSPCTEEVAVFRAFAATVARGADRVVVIDTAPTGHTLLLLDATEAYHREVVRAPSGNPAAVQRLLPRLRDRAYTHVVLVTLPEATPVHEAMHLERELARAGITPHGWVVSQALTPLVVTDPVLRRRQAAEATHLRELRAHGAHLFLDPWSPLLP